MKTTRQILLILCLLLAKNIFAQTDYFNLPTNIYSLNFNSSTQKEVKKLFGKPNTTSSYKKSGCVTFKYKSIVWEYKEKGLLFIFSISDTNKTYTLSHIGILINSPIIIGTKIVVGESSYEQIIADLGKPENLFQIEHYNDYRELVYKPKENSRWKYRLALDQDKKLTKVSIFENDYY